MDGVEVLIIGFFTIVAISATGAAFWRGVEDETLSCGTGVTASAIVSYHNEVGFNNVTVITKGGTLTVEFDRLDDGIYKDIWLCGPAEKVFEGKMELK